MIGVDFLDFQSGPPGPLFLAFVEYLCDCGFHCSAKTQEEADRLLNEHKKECPMATILDTKGVGR